MENFFSLGLVEDGLVWFGLVWFGRFGRFGLVNEDDFYRPQVPLKEAKATLELQLGTIPGRSGPGRSGSVRSNSDIKANSVQLCWGWD